MTIMPLALAARIEIDRIVAGAIAALAALPLAAATAQEVEPPAEVAEVPVALDVPAPKLLDFAVHHTIAVTGVRIDSSVQCAIEDRVLVCTARPVAQEAGE